jgi:hypothetical protein
MQLIHELQLGIINCCKRTAIAGSIIAFTPWWRKTSFKCKYRDIYIYSALFAIVVAQ